jgi:biopolymer transport protein ExbD
MKSGRKLKKPEKLNLVPILDSVFIFIFFLLMSAQFLDVYEIGSSVPMTKEVPDKSEKDPLNLTVRITKDKIEFKAGTRSPIHKEFTHDDKDKVIVFLMELKKRHPAESTMIVKADAKIPFQTVIKIIDQTRAPASSKDKLFDQVVMDTGNK